MSEDQTQTQPAAAVTEIPNFYEQDGQTLRKLRPKDFPRSRDGKKAFYEYKALVCESFAKIWRDKVQGIDKADDPIFQQKRRADKLRAQLAKIEAELAKSGG